MANDHGTHLLDTAPWRVTMTYMLAFIGIAIVYFFVDSAWGHHIPLTLNDLQQSPALIGEGVMRLWLIFLWAGLLSVISGFIRNALPFDRYEVLARGLWLSINGGIFEEFIFRWLLFFCLMPVLHFVNVGLFGIPKNIFANLIIPLANFATLGMLSPQLHSAQWVIGAAMVLAGFGFINVQRYVLGLQVLIMWLLGMAMFFVLFNYGIVAAMVAHATYSAVVFGGKAIVTPG